MIFVYQRLISQKHSHITSKLPCTAFAYCTYLCITRVPIWQRSYITSLKSRVGDLGSLNILLVKLMYHEQEINLKGEGSVKLAFFMTKYMDVPYFHVSQFGTLRGASHSVWDDKRSLYVLSPSSILTKEPSVCVNWARFLYPTNGRSFIPLKILFKIHT